MSYPLSSPPVTPSNLFQTMLQNLIDKLIQARQDEKADSSFLSWKNPATPSFSVFSVFSSTKRDPRIPFYSDIFSRAKKWSAAISNQCKDVAPGFHFVIEINVHNQLQYLISGKDPSVFRNVSLVSRL